MKLGCFLGLLFLATNIHSCRIIPGWQSHAKFDTSDFRTIENKSLVETLQELGKVYHVTFVYPNGLPTNHHRFTMGYSIKQPLKELLDGLACPFWSQNIKFKIRGKTVFVWVIKSKGFS